MSWWKPEVGMWCLNRINNQKYLLGSNLKCLGRGGVSLIPAGLMNCTHWLLHRLRALPLARSNPVYGSALLSATNLSSPVVLSAVRQSTLPTSSCCKLAGCFPATSLEGEASRQYTILEQPSSVAKLPYIHGNKKGPRIFMFCLKIA